MARGEARTVAGRAANTGVAVGDVASYSVVQHLEQTGDGLTGDHQPSGAAIKEAIRQKLHTALKRPLTRSMARNAYKKAITVVVEDIWHRKFSRTYGGRNSRAQIAQDAADLSTASVEDFKLLVPELESNGYTDQEIQEIWDDLCQAREQFFQTGDAQSMI